MKVVCIKDNDNSFENFFYDSHLTIGKTYETINIVRGSIYQVCYGVNCIETKKEYPNNVCYLVKNDIGGYMWYKDFHFEPLSDNRNKKIEEILNGRKENIKV